MKPREDWQRNIPVNGNAQRKVVVISNFIPERNVKRYLILKINWVALRRLRISFSVEHFVRVRFACTINQSQSKFCLAKN